MLFLQENELEEIKSILDGYTFKLNEIDKNSEEYEILKYRLDNEFCGLNIWQEESIIHSELYLGNVIINDDILTCIHNNKLYKYRMVNRKAENNEYVYITNSHESFPFNSKYIGRCFKVNRQPTKAELKYIKPHVCIGTEELDYECCLYDTQYVVLEEI